MKDGTVSKSRIQEIIKKHNVKRYNVKMQENTLQWWKYASSVIVWSWA